METAVAWAGRSGGAEPGGGARDIASLEKVARPQISCLVARRILNSFGQRLGGAQGIPEFGRRLGLCSFSKREAPGGQRSCLKL